MQNQFSFGDSFLVICFVSDMRVENPLPLVNKYMDTNQARKKNDIYIVRLEIVKIIFFVFEKVSPAKKERSHNNAENLSLVVIGKIYLPVCIYNLASFQQLQNVGCGVASFAVPDFAVITGIYTLCWREKGENFSSDIIFSY